VIRIPLRATSSLAIPAAFVTLAVSVVSADPVGPIGVAPGTVNAIDAHLASIVGGTHLSSEWRAQIPNLIGMALRVESSQHGEMTVTNPHRYLGTQDILLKKIEIQETSESFWNVTIDNKASADLKAVFGSASIGSKDLETIEVVSTISANLKGLAGEENDIGENITAGLKPGQQAIWLTGFTVYRLKHTHFREKDKHAGIGIGAISANGAIYNKVDDNRLTYIIVPTGYIYTQQTPPDNAFMEARVKTSQLGNVGLIQMPNGKTP